MADVREFGKESVESRKELYRVLSEECMVIVRRVGEVGRLN